jgi:hypothetical protein
MDDIPTATVTWLIILFCTIGAIVGGLVHAGQTEISAGIIIAFFTVCYFLGWLIRFFVPQFTQYENTTQSVVERVVLAINVEGSTQKFIHGLNRDEIRAIGQCVTANDAYTFSVQHFKDYFAGSNIDGYSLYTKSVRWMKDVGALVPNSKGGVDVTEIGEQVFICMRDGSWEEIKEYEDTPLP